MVREHTCPPTAVGGTPLSAAGRGLVGGLAGTLLLSVVSRLLPGLRHGGVEISFSQSGRFLEPTLARALAVALPPGPEGLAQQFAFKVAAGLFGRDIGPRARLAGVGVHLAYGVGWGMLYGLIQASHHHPSAAAGVVYGFAVWLVGPGFLVPAMRLMGSPATEPPARTASLIAGHLVYGVALATTVDTLQRQRR